MSDATAVLLAVACFVGAAFAVAALAGVLMGARRTARQAALVREGVERSGGATAWVPGHGITEVRTEADGPEPVAALSTGAGTPSSRATLRQRLAAARSSANPLDHEQADTQQPDPERDEPTREIRGSAHPSEQE